ncbi:hypothetical protein [Streptomyces sp. NPDC048106]|uniref:hypothetical protein n=1 Tax=Streptomyces sp. NPDC048106 TaxID=3155750 RepID=UPI00345372F7
MRSMAFVMFALSAVMILMACVKADRVRSWRSSVNPSAPDLGDGYFVVVRVVLLGMAAFGLYYGFHDLRISDQNQWSKEELAAAVRSATDDLNGKRTDTPYEDTSDLYNGFEMTIEDTVAEHAGGSAPRFALDVTGGEPGGDGSNKREYVVTADGAGSTFCMRVNAVRDKSGDHDVPAAGGGSVKVYAYVLKVTSSHGEC